MNNCNHKKRAQMYACAWFFSLVLFGSCVTFFKNVLNGAQLEYFLGTSLSYRFTVLIFTVFCLLPLLAATRYHAKIAEMKGTTFFASIMLIQHSIWLVLCFFETIKQLSIK